MPQLTALPLTFPPQPFDDTSLEVVDVSSSGLPTRFPHIEQRQARDLLYKAATKLSTVNDLPRVAAEVFSCGWPDITVRFRFRGASASDTHAWTLRAPQPDCASPGHGGAHAA